MFGNMFKSIFKMGEKQSSKNNFKIMQVENDIRILNECLTIIDNTDKLDTFFSRWDLVEKKLDVLLEAEQKGLAHGISQINNNLLENKTNLFIRVAERNYERMISDIQKLKTAKGKINRIDKYLREIMRYDSLYRMYRYDLYLGIVARARELKEQLK